ITSSVVVSSAMAEDAKVAREAKLAQLLNQTFEHNNQISSTPKIQRVPLFWHTQNDIIWSHSSWQPKSEATRTTLEISMGELRSAGVIQNLLQNDEELAKFLNDIGHDLPTKMFNQLFMSDAVPISKKYIQVRRQIEKHYS
ncbi:hypothetical protein S245_028600, partial [Arachis hypogaea]